MTPFSRVQMRIKLTNASSRVVNEMLYIKVKNNNSLFERPFKVKKNGVFLFGISFFVLEIFTFLCYANEGSDDVIDRSTLKTIKY